MQKNTIYVEVPILSPKITLKFYTLKNWQVAGREDVKRLEDLGMPEYVTGIRECRDARKPDQKTDLKELARTATQAGTRGLAEEDRVTLNIVRTGSPWNRTDA